jgi:hypothetical protein
LGVATLVRGCSRRPKKAAGRALENASKHNRILGEAPAKNKNPPLIDQTPAASGTDPYPRDTRGYHMRELPESQALVNDE